MKRHMRYQRAAKKIPVVLSAEEVARLLEAAPEPGLRYRAAFSVAYGGGLRASEVTHLKVGAIDSDRMLIRVDQGKGCKDRHVMLSPSSRRRSHAIRCNTALPPIFWGAGLTSASSRCCLAMPS